MVLLSPGAPSSCPTLLCLWGLKPSWGWGRAGQGPRLEEGVVFPQRSVEVTVTCHV